MNKIGNTLAKLIKYAVWIGLALLLTLGIVKGCSRKPPEKKMPPKIVRAVKAEAKDADISIESFGNLYSPYNVNIMSQVTGEIKEVHFKDGDIVKKGDMLFTIDPSSYKATLDKAEAQLIQDLANLKLNKDTLERNRKLLAKELISQQAFEQYETSVTASEAMIKLDNANIDLAKINLAYCYIASPIDGVCGKRQVDPGNIVTANSGPTLVNIKTVDPLYVDFTIPERDLNNVREAMAKGQLKVVISIAREGNGPVTREGALHFIDNAIDNTTGTILLRASVDNKDSALWAGQFANLLLILRREKDAVLIPYESIQVGQDKGKLFDYVFIVTPDNKSEIRKITVGNKVNDHMIVNEGIKAGEYVVTAGQMGLRPGADVEIAGTK
ncbi:MAG TPA: efflux RND transporter periplasmic adaptor subunit [Candidatus Omnitrophota bacterium]|nr:efflux RND transporter periplasmic adaptor subunit [Candidatus Omnitrophota bacterium]HRZ66966.1 efflux RND transporter periplasmic adaptor subunit [Candidatus Omnitrophota bacterium]